MSRCSKDGRDPRQVCSTCEVQVREFDPKGGIRRREDENVCSYPPFQLRVKTGVAFLLIVVSSNERKMTLGKTLPMLPLGRGS
jgi:hypothetical protein